ncbi:MAG: hypothetical protein FJX68_11005 [Alphaproteobacteria bacterium]|nr:hypothetical protein [Alphaproteobacteria bacterium]
MRALFSGSEAGKPAQFAATIAGAVAGGMLALAAGPSVAAFAIGLWRDYVTEGFLQALGTFFFC